MRAILKHCVNRNCYLHQSFAQQRECLKPLREKVSKLEQQLGKEHAHWRKLETQLADPALYEEAHKKKLAALLQEQGELKNRISATEEAWLQASDALA